MVTDMSQYLKFKSHQSIRESIVCHHSRCLQPKVSLELQEYSNGMLYSGRSTWYRLKKVCSLCQIKTKVTLRVGKTRSFWNMIEINACILSTNYFIGLIGEILRIP